MLDIFLNIFVVYFIFFLDVKNVYFKKVQSIYFLMLIGILIINP